MLSSPVSSAPRGQSALEISDLRFLVPPVLLFALLGSPLLFYPQIQPCSVKHFALNMLDSQGPYGNLLAILAGGLIIVAFGVIIGAASFFMQRAIGQCLKYGLGMIWRKEAISALLQLYKFRNDKVTRAESEMVDAVFSAKYHTQLLHDWIRRRWQFCVINMNCLVASIIAVGFKELIKINAGREWWGIWCALILVFSANTFWTYRDTMDLQHFVLRNLKRFDGSQSSLLGNSEPPHTSPSPPEA